MRKVSILIAVCLAAGVALGQTFTDVDKPQYHGWQELNKALDANYAKIHEGTDGATASTLVTAAERIGAAHQTTLTLAIPVGTLSLADGDHGTGTNIYTFSEGRVLIIGAAIDAAVTNTANFNASDDDHFYVSVGTAVGADDNDLTSTEADIIAKTTIDTAAGATLWTQWEADMTAGADTVFDGTAAAAGLYVNAAVEATDNSGANTVGVIGTLKITWVNLGDD